MLVYGTLTANDQRTRLRKVNHASHLALTRSFSSASGTSSVRSAQPYRAVGVYSARSTSANQGLTGPS